LQLFCRPYVDCNMVYLQKCVQALDVAHTGTWLIQT
jgi:hypothetical protein